ncbi:MAG TPA: DNA polymerase Y family protein [Xanthobacteraceae bacterium]|nr:DNA polymerase Y family protein [Xanthobacteraceae bacterium]
MLNGVSISRHRFLSLWLMRLATDRIARQRLAPDLRPLVITGKWGNVERLTAVDAAAAELGLKPGLALAEARARYPDLAVVAEHPADDRRLLDAIADWCQRYTPLLAVDLPDGLLLDIAGCAHLFGGEEGLLADLLARLESFGFATRAAIASTIGAAFALARFGPAGILASGAERTALTPLPMAALRLPEETVGALRRVGLKRIGDILDLPRAPLAARFGTDVLRQLARALGMEREPLTPLLPVAAYVAEQPFAEPIAREEDVLRVLERLASRLKPVLERRGEGARRIELALFRTDGAVRRIVVSTARPMRDPSDLRALYVERLASLADPLDPGFGFDLARLSVLAAEPCAPEQIGLGARADDADLASLIDRLSTRLGARRVMRLIANDSHIPEVASGSVPAQAGRACEHGWAAFRRFRSNVELSPRPLRLLAKPEPIEAIATVPDGPPVRFRWRRALHEVIAADGPERIEGAWWSEEGGPARDYFRVEDKAGHRFWVFRAGLYRLTAQPQWFLHGTFG